MSQAGRFLANTGPGSGTVTSITAGTGLTSVPNPITTTGTISLTIPVVVSSGGTGNITYTPNEIIVAGTTATGPFQQIAPATAGFILTSNGAAAPTFQAPPAGGLVSLTPDTGTTPVVPVAGTIDITGYPQTPVSGVRGVLSIGSASPGILQISNLDAVTPYVVGLNADTAPFTVIQDAINAAISDGASATSPTVVWITPGLYTENLALAPFVHLTGTGTRLSCQILGSAIYSGTSGAPGQFAATNVTFISQSLGAAIEFEGTDTVQVALDALDINAGTAGGIGLECSGAGFTIILSNSTLEAPSGAQCKNISAGNVECFSLVTRFTDTASTISGAGILSIVSSDIQDAFSLTGSAIVYFYDDFVVSSNFSSLPCITMVTGTSAFAINSIFETSAPYFVTGTGDFFYSSLVQDPPSAIDPGITQIGLTTLVGNLSFDGGATTISSNGQLIIGVTGARPVIGTLTAGSGVTITNGPGTVTIAATGSGGIATIAGDSGTVTGSTVSLLASTGSANAGASIKFIASSATEMDLQVTDATFNTYMGQSCGTTAATTGNTAFGYSNFPIVTTADAGGNVAFGRLNFVNYTGGSAGVNAAIGQLCLYSLTTGGANMAMGSNALDNLLTGSYNTAIGFNAGGPNYTGSESSNICINATTSTVTGENNTCRIGNGTGSSNQQLAQTFISGINGVTSSNPMMVTIDSVTDQLGVAAIPGGGGSGIVTINTDFGGSVTGSTVSISAQPSTQGTSRFNGSGTAITLQYDDGNTNLGIGAGSMPPRGFGGNTCVGVGAGHSIDNSTGNNTAFGQNALFSNTSAWKNVAIGGSALQNLTSDGNGSGQLNTVVGYRAGYGYTFAEYDNICLGGLTQGTAGEVSTLRIGSGTGSSQTSGLLNRAFICGINGITVTGTAVLVSTGDQLGIAVSSERFKENISDLKDSKVLELKPKRFNYSVGDDRTPQTGLIAEEVYEIMPELVVLDKEGLPQSVKYHDLPVLLLNEIIKLRKELNALKEQL